jgi:predicted nucleic acid-binding Zn ribbon protein
MALITCPDCNSEISDQATSCPKCGFPIKTGQKEISAEAKETVEKPARPRKKTRIGFVIIVLLIGAIGAIVLSRTDTVINKPNDRAQTPTAEYVPIERHSKLFDGSIIVNAAQWRYKEFTAFDSWRNIHVKGTFRASGGTGNDIRALVMTKNDFTNMVNGHPASSLYDSGKLTVSDIYVRLPSDSQNYVLAFDNTFSSVTDKEIDAHIDLVYTF